jgi:hypothetical protein
MARDRDFDLAGGKTMNTRKSLLALSLLACSFLANDAMAQYAPVGVQTDVPEATVTGGGWTPCYSSSYTDATSLAVIQASCDESNLMMACRPSGDPNFTVLAQASRADVFFDTGDGSTPHDANGVGWYYSDNFSWGFAAQGEPIFRTTCDTGSSLPEQRMCIHTSGGTTQTGWRCGAYTGLSGPAWERVVLEADLSPSAPTSGVFIGDAGDNVPVVVAGEVVVPPSPTISNVDNALDIVTNVDYAFSPGEVRYARMECPDIVFDDSTTVAYFGDASNTIGAVNGIGSDAIYFSITAGASPVLAGDQLAIGGDRGISAAQATDCTYGLYDFPSEAQAGGADGRVATASGGYLRYGPSYALDVTSQGLATADVESDPVFSRFTDDSPTGDPLLGQLGGFVLGTVEDVSGDAQPIGLDGTPIEMGDLLDGATALVFGGDFSSAAAVFLSEDEACLDGLLEADSYDDSEAVFIVGPASGTAYLCLLAGDEAIPAGDFTVALDAVPLDPATYATPDIAAQPIGSIVHNGTELKAPLAQVPGAGWLSRMVLTNTGGIDRPYVISVMGETGNTIGTDNTTGVVPANGTVVVDLTTVMTSFSAGQQRRGTLIVTVAAPNNQIQGLYQIVNTNSGSLSNHVMVRPVVEEGR